jgi:betaine-aldehyde dehydrogenase
VQFTGSTKTGRAIATQAASRLIPYSLELGGKDPAIVLADADLEFTAAGIAFGALTNSGQMCTSIERVYVEESAFGPLVDRLAETVRGLRQNCDDGYATDICTLTTAAQLENVKRHVADAVSKGARIVLGGNPTGNGFGYEPTILVNVNHTMDVMREESFGPLLPVMSVVNADEAIELANDSPYGLAASIWSGDRKRAEALALQLEAGSVDINDSSAHLLCFPLPQSGWKQSGIGTRFGGEHGIHKYCRTQGIVSPRVEASFIAKLLWFPYSAGKAQLVDRVFRLLSARDLRRRLGFRGKN